MIDRTHRSTELTGRANHGGEPGDRGILPSGMVSIGLPVGGRRGWTLLLPYVEDDPFTVASVDEIMSFRRLVEGQGTARRHVQGAFGGGSGEAGPGLGSPALGQFWRPEDREFARCVGLLSGRGLRPSNRQSLLEDER